MKDMKPFHFTLALCIATGAYCFPILLSNSLVWLTENESFETLSIMKV